MLASDAKCCDNMPFLYGLVYVEMSVTSKAKKKAKLPVLSTDTAIRKRKTPGFYRCAANLYVRINSRGKYFVFRWRDRHQVTKGGLPKVRDLGIGFYGKADDQYSLAEAKVEAAKWRSVVAQGRDPKTVKAAEIAAEAPDYAPTFSEASATYIEAQKGQWENPKHHQQWINTLKTYADPSIGKLPVNQIEEKHVLAILEPIWATKHETATRVRQRIESVMSWAEAKGYRKGMLNPARRNAPQLRPGNVLPKVKKSEIREHFAALQYTEAHEFASRLQSIEGTAARCLEFTLLTASRIGSVLQAEWSQIDFDARIWNCPVDIMKKKKFHRVPLSDRAIEVLKAQIGLHEDWVFPSPTKDQPICSTTIDNARKSVGDFRSADGRKITTHGFRTCFQSWVSECTSHPEVLIEFSLAHSVKGVKAAYFDPAADLIERRRPLMEQWGQFLSEPPAAGKVSTLKATA